MQGMVFMKVSGNITVKGQSHELVLPLTFAGIEK